MSWGTFSQALDQVLQQGQRARTKALLRLLIGEIRVVSPTNIRPTWGGRTLYAQLDCRWAPLGVLSPSSEPVTDEATCVPTGSDGAGMLPCSSPT